MKSEKRGFRNEVLNFVVQRLESNYWIQRRQFFVDNSRDPNSALACVVEYRLYGTHQRPSHHIPLKQKLNRSQNTHNQREAEDVVVLRLELP
ncbi:unnamed protein product [Sphenostylis stenocarpa]|uniref:Uncharacterized protein n=1 Tax=Sphenostylis stenocarpa TaxID=92480 RepID=A0AA86TR61_9FABA|nr:unnamed protein product [Sphenostylis stenocarpa]